MLGRGREACRTITTSRRPRAQAPNRRTAYVRPTDDEGKTDKLDVAATLD